MWEKAYVCVRAFKCSNVPLMITLCLCLLEGFGAPYGYGPATPLPGYGKPRGTHCACNSICAHNFTPITHSRGVFTLFCIVFTLRYTSHYCSSRNSTQSHLFLLFSFVGFTPRMPQVILPVMRFPQPFPISHLYPY